MLFLKAIGIWAILVIVAIVNGTFRVAVLNPRFSDLTAHQISSVTGSVLILPVTMSLIPILGASSTKGLLGIGLLWLALTVTFEFSFGHFVAGHSD
ncbi:MAG: hypothetical protein NTU53_20225 [Planctomycetota bacterium]|nr:hypothetical protein [Planctomycetota bacterium]